MEYKENEISESDMEGYVKVQKILTQKAVEIEREKKKLYMREFRARDREKHLVYQRKWHAEHREQQKAYMREKYKRDREKQIKDATEWTKNNYERFLINQRASSANKKYPGKISGDDVREIIEREKRTCHWCGKKELKGKDLTLEHLQPINDKQYIVLACYSCNCRRIVGKKENQYTKNKETVLH